MIQHSSRCSLSGFHGLWQPAIWFELIWVGDQIWISRFGDRVKDDDITGGNVHTMNVHIIVDPFRWNHDCRIGQTMRLSKSGMKIGSWFDRDSFGCQNSICRFQRLQHPKNGKLGQCWRVGGPSGVILVVADTLWEFASVTMLQFRSTAFHAPVPLSCVCPTLNDQACCCEKLLQRKAALVVIAWMTMDHGESNYYKRSCVCQKFMPTWHKPTQQDTRYKVQRMSWRVKCKCSLFRWMTLSNLSILVLFRICWNFARLLDVYLEMHMCSIAVPPTIYP